MILLRMWDLQVDSGAVGGGSKQMGTQRLKVTGAIGVWRLHAKQPGLGRH